MGWVGEVEEYILGAAWYAEMFGWMMCLVLDCAVLVLCEN